MTSCPTLGFDPAPGDVAAVRSLAATVSHTLTTLSGIRSTLDTLGDPGRPGGDSVVTQLGERPVGSTRQPPVQVVHASGLRTAAVQLRPQGRQVRAR